MYVFTTLAGTTWWRALTRLEEASIARDRVGTAGAYTALYAALAACPACDLFEAAAADLLFSASPLTAAGVAADPPRALLKGAERDLQNILALLHHDWLREAETIVGEGLPPLAPLAAPAGGRIGALAERLRHAGTSEVLRELLERYREEGGGSLARFPAFRWSGGTLQGIAHPAQPDAARLVGLENALEKLFVNTETFLSDGVRRGGAQHALLYGPRGSGKSTALKSLGPLYADRGLRLVEVAPTHLGDLPEILALLRGRPHRYLLFADDLSFAADSAAYAPLKSLLEGSLSARPGNVLLYATSNRRHLVTERFSDRPDPLNDDVHAWDTQHERLALADRFGLLITFPDATQKRYLEIVRNLAQREGLEVSDEQAIRFAEWGNGLSGRTAQQFVEVFKSGLG